MHEARSILIVAIEAQLSAEFTNPLRRELIFPLTNAVVISICAVICGAADFVAIAKFDGMKLKWLVRFLDLGK